MPLHWPLELQVSLPDDGAKHLLRLSLIPPSCGSKYTRYSMYNLVESGARTQVIHEEGCKSCWYRPNSPPRSPSEVFITLPRSHLRHTCCWVHCVNNVSPDPVSEDSLEEEASLKKNKSRHSTVPRTAISTFECPEILKRPKERPGHEVNLKVSFCPSPPQFPSLNFVSSASSSFSQRLNSLCRLQRYPNSHILLLCLGLCRPHRNNSSQRTTVATRNMITSSSS